MILSIIDRVNHPLRPWRLGCISPRLCRWVSYMEAVRIITDIKRERNEGIRDRG